MSFTKQYFKDAEGVVMGVLQAYKPELMKHYGKVETELKADTSIVTHLDKELELKIKAALNKFDAGVGTWGEEFGQEGDKKNYWLIDPIDMTEHFVRGDPDSRNLVTLIENDQPVLALAYVFAKDELYRAARGEGTTKNDRRLKMSDRPLERAWLEFSVNMMDPTGYKIYKTLRPHVAGLPQRYHFFDILEGVLDGLVVYKSRGAIWDYAPRALLIQEAGGRVANFDSDDYQIEDVHLIATNPVIFEDVRKILSGIT